MSVTQLLCLSEAVSPVSHAGHAAGNESLVAREDVMTARGKIGVPYLSGNAVRNRLVRNPGADWLIREYHLKDRFTHRQINAIKDGGTLTESTAREDLRLQREVDHYWPLLRLVGFCLPGQLFEGNLDVWRGNLVCEENRDSLDALSGGLLPEQRLRSSEEWIGDYQYTSHDSSRQALHSDLSREQPSGMMLFAGQSVGKGAQFLHGFVVKTDDELQMGALLLSLALWNQSPTIGGKSSIGHGRLFTRLLEGEFDQHDLISQYVAHARRVKDEAIAWFDAAFGIGEETEGEDPPKKKRGRKKKGESNGSD